MPPRKPTAAAMTFLYAFHAAFSGAFLVAYLTGDEDTYGIHMVAGYVVLAALAARLAAGLFAAAGPLRFPRPDARATLDWLGRVVAGDARARTQRSPLLAWMAVALLVGVGGAAVSGAIADFVPPLEDLHEALGEASLTIVLAHIALVLALYGLKNPQGIADTLRAWGRRLRITRQEARTQ